LGTLYVVATPIGNLEDVTLRALRVLKEVDLIAAEDTRRTRKLLNRYNISTPMTSCFEHNERVKGPAIIKKIVAGSDVAFVTDAGTPAVSDPGFRIVRLAVDASVRVVAVPGPSALTSVLSVSGLPTDEFTFKGFVPARAAARKKFLEALRGADTTIVLYESARRLRATALAISEVLGDVPIVIAREMTKLHEEVLRGTAGELAERLNLKGGGVLKGEVTIVMSVPAAAGPSARTVTEEITKLLKSGMGVKEAAAVVSGELGVPRRAAYAEALRIKARQ
jgi:16S rRNA (cytidine1402-2'-O)-methyltransferase